MKIYTVFKAFFSHCKSRQLYQENTKDLSCSKPLKSIQIVGADFDSAIAANQLMPEVNTDFRYVVISRQNQGSNKIVTAITPSFERRYLRSGDNNWFSCEKLIILYSKFVRIRILAENFYRTNVSNHWFSCEK